MAEYNSPTLEGRVMGGHQPVSGAVVTVFRAGDGSSYYPTGAGAATPCVVSPYGACASVLGTGTTNASGQFNITRTNVCDTSAGTTDQVYIVAAGGNPGLAAGTNNTAAVMLAAIGPCAAPGSLIVNELTTAAAAYALSGFATFDGTSVQIGTSSTNKAGLQHAFANAAALVNVADSSMHTTTPGGNGTISAAVLGTVANALAQCVNSSSVLSTGCSNLAAPAPTGSALVPVTPLNTWQMALETALYPSNNVSGVFATAGTPTGGQFYTPTLSAEPTDFSLAIAYTLGGAVAPVDVAADANGNLWVSGMTGAPLVETDYAGNVLSGAGGYGDAGFKALTTVGKLAVDTNTVGTTGVAPGVWVASTGGSLYQFTQASGALAHTYALPTSLNAGAYTVANSAYAVAIDAGNNVFYSTTTGSASTLNTFGEVQLASGTYAPRTTWSANPSMANATPNQGSTYLGVSKAATPVLWGTGTAGTPYVFTPSSTSVTSAGTNASTLAVGVQFDAANAAYISGASGACSGKTHNGQMNRYTAASTVTSAYVPPTLTTCVSPKPSTGLGVDVMDGAGRIFAVTFALNASSFPVGLAQFNSGVGLAPGTWLVNGLATSSNVLSVQPVNSAGVPLLATTVFTGNTTNGSATITSPSSTAGLYVGEAVSGVGLAVNATILKISPLTLSANATATAAAVSITATGAMIKNMAVDTAGSLWIANSAPSTTAVLIEVLGVAAPTKVIAAGGGVRP